MSYIELYIDETGDSPGNRDKPFTIGGVYAIYNNKKQAHDFNHDLHKAGVQYFFLKNDFAGILYPKYSLGSPREKNSSNAKADIEIFNNVLEGYSNILVRTIRLTYVPSVPEDALAVNITMLKYLIELFLYEILPVMTNDENNHVSIFVATRVQKHGENKTMSEEYKYGIGYREITNKVIEKGQPKFYKEYLSFYISSDTPYLLMKEIETMHNNKKIVDTKTFRLLGVTMIYQKGYSGDNRNRCLWEDYIQGIIYETDKVKDKNTKLKNLIPLQRPMHYIADAMLSNPESFNEDRVGCMLETYDKEDLPKFINASRLLDQGKYLEALQEVIAIENLSELEASQQGRKYILARLGKQAVPEISNEDFYHLVSTYKVQKAQQNKAQQDG